MAVNAGSSSLKFQLILMPQEDVLKKNITHWAIYAEQRNKIDTLRKVILAEKPEKALIFTQYKEYSILKIGNRLGVPAVMNSLSRTRLGDFNIDDACGFRSFYGRNFSSRRP